jgi:hypothetical protein
VSLCRPKFSPFLSFVSTSRRVLHLGRHHKTILRTACIFLLALSALVSANPSPSAARRAPMPIPSATRKRAELPQNPLAALSSHNALSKQLCPEALHACPVPGSPGPLPQSLDEFLAKGWECADFDSDIVSCGGCAALEPR